ncbi:MAG: endonuclease/exonuclease/phosphatase family protein [bacterium]
MASNRVLNNGFESLWGSGNVLARHWTRSNTSYCYATSSDSHSGTASIYITNTDISQVNYWTSEKLAVTPNATYSCQVWAKWAGISSGSIRVRFRSYDVNGSGNYVGELTLSTTGNSSGAWVQLTGNYTIPSTGKCLDIYLALENANSSAWIYFDDVSVVNLTPGTPPDNLIINSDFEGIDGTYPAFWRRNTGTTNAGSTTGIYRSATTSLYIKQNSGDNFTREWYISEESSNGYIAIDSTKNYRFGGWLQWDKVTVENIGFRVEWMDYSDNTINISAIATNGVSTSQWMNLDSGVISPPSGAVAARVRLFNTDTVSVNATVWFDDVYFEETNQPQSSFSTRVLTYNIEGSSQSNTYCLQTIANIIAAENPDIVSLNEVYRYTLGNKQDQIIVGYLGSQWTTVFSTNDSGIGYTFGNAILSRYPIVASVNHLIQPQLGFEQRGCLEAHINVNGTMVTAFSTHWASDTEVERQLSADSCLVWLSQVPEPKLLMGDFNARSYSNPLRRMQTQYIDSIGVSAFGQINTVSNPNPTVRIDHILLPENTTIKEAHVVNYGDATVASDHRPITTLFIGGGYLKPEIPTPNRIYNSGFEYVNLDTILQWFPTNTVLCRVTTDSYTGTYSVLCKSTADMQSNKWQSNFISVTPGKTYTCSVWAKWAGITVGNMQVDFKCYTDNSSAYYSDNAIGSITIQTTGSSGGWIQLTGTYLVPTTGSAMRVILSLNSATPGAIGIYDDVSVISQQDIPENLIINNGFEGKDDGNLGYGGYWRRSTGSGNGRQDYTYYVSPTTSYWIMNPPGTNLYRRAYQAYAEVTSVGSPIIIPITIDTTKNYRFGAKLRTYCAASSGGYAQAGIQLYWYDQTNRQISITTTYLSISNNSALSAWVDLTGTIGKQNIPSGSAYTHFNIYLYSTLSFATAWFDEVYFMEDDYTPVELSRFELNISEVNQENFVDENDNNRMNLSNG